MKQSSGRRTRSRKCRMVAGHHQGGLDHASEVGPRWDPSEWLVLLSCHFDVLDAGCGFARTVRQEWHWTRD